jgi:hypothetical protein
MTDSTQVRVDQTGWLVAHGLERGDQLEGTVGGEHAGKWPKGQIANG